MDHAPTLAVQRTVFAAAAAGLTRLIARSDRVRHAVVTLVRRLGRIHRHCAGQARQRHCGRLQRQKQCRKGARQSAGPLEVMTSHGDE